MNSEDKVIRKLQQRLNIHQLCQAMGWKPQRIIGSDEIFGYTKGLKIVDEDAFIEQEYWTMEDISEELKKMADRATADLSRSEDRTIETARRQLGL